MPDLPDESGGSNALMDFLFAPSDADARALAAARLRALRRREPAALALALTPEPGARTLGTGMLGAEPHAEEQFARLGQERMQNRQAEERLAQGWAGLNLGKWQPVSKVNPVTGEMVSFMVDTRTGEVRPIGGSASGKPAMPRLTSEQAKMAASVSTAIQAFPRALKAGLPESGGLSGTLQGVQQMASRAGFPGLASQAAVETDAFWFGVIAPVINAQTGQQMSYQEYQRRWAGYAPRPGEPRQTQLSKVHQLVDILQGYLVGLPPQLQDTYGQELDAIRQQAIQQFGSAQGQNEPFNIGVFPLPPPPARQEAPGAPAMSPSHVPLQPQEGTVGGRRVIFRR